MHLGTGGGYKLYKSQDRAVWVVDNKDSADLGSPCGKAQDVALCVYRNGALDRLAFEECTPQGQGRDLNKPFAVAAGQQVKLHCKAKTADITVEVVGHAADKIAHCSQTFAARDKAEATDRMRPLHHVIGIQIVP